MNKSIGDAHRGGFGPAAELRPPKGALSRIGGEGAVDRVIDGLYERIRADPELHRVFPHFHNEGVQGFFREWLGGKGFAVRHCYKLTLCIPPDKSVETVERLAILGRNLFQAFFPIVFADDLA